MKCNDRGGEQSWLRHTRVPLAFLHPQVPPFAPAAAAPVPPLPPDTSLTLGSGSDRNRYPASTFSGSMEYPRGGGRQFYLPQVFGPLPYKGGTSVVTLFFCGPPHPSLIKQYLIPTITIKWKELVLLMSEAVWNAAPLAMLDTPPTHHRRRAQGT